MDETTTDVATQETGAYDAQPDEQPIEAVTTTDESTVTDPSDDEPESTDTSTDDDLSDYWTKKGIDISTPEGQAQAAKSYREAEKKMHANSQKASELERQVNSQPLAASTDDPAVQDAISRAASVETKLAIRDFKELNRITPQEDQALGQYIVDNPDKGWLLKNGHLSYDNILAMSGVRSPDTSAIRKAGGQDALTTLANKQRATAATGNATNTQPPAGLTKANAESWWDGLGADGRKDPANRARLDSVL